MADSTLSNLTSLTLPSQATDLLLVGRGTDRPNKVALSDALNSSGLAATTTAYGVVQLAASGGTTAGTVVQATDARLSDTRNPPDGDKGDITVASGTSWSIDNDVVTYAKMQNVSAASKLLGRGSAAGSGDVEEITLGTGLSMSGTTLTATGGGGGAPTDAEYLVKTSDATLSAERVVTDSTSVVANWVTGGQVSFERAALTGDVTATANSNATTIANDAVTNAKLANVATATIKGRVSASTGDPEDLTGTQATTLLDVFTSSLKGLAPSSGGGTSNFLRADGTWAAPAGGGTSAQVDTYTTTGTVHTWSKPSGAKAVQIIAFGAGGGGGGGTGNASAVNRSGGGGGGGGACTKVVYEADSVPASLYIIVGLGGTGGASGTAGVGGTNSTVASNNTNPPTNGVFARAGGGGGGGQGVSTTGGNGGGGGGGCGGAGATSASSAAVSGGLPATAFTGAAVSGQGGGGGFSNSSYSGRAEWGGGGGASTRVENDFRSAGGGSMYGGGGGGCGAGLNAAGAVAGGSGGGPSGSYEGSTPVGSRTATLPGGDGQASANGTAGSAAGTYSAGGGGGGGGANNAGTGYTGGAGGSPSGGGGGGGASSTAGSGGVGGAGANGKVVVITYF